jgi:hypothetical protein
MTRVRLIENLAAIEHERWADWQKYIHARCAIVESKHTGHHYQGIPIDLYNGWQRQIATPYEDLSEREKDSDREQVMRYFPLLVEFVAQWLDEHEEMDNPSIERSAAWRADMMPRE